jgi:hypothetical protein
VLVFVCSLVAREIISMCYVRHDGVRIESVQICCLVTGICELFINISQNNFSVNIMQNQRSPQGL